jgi:predicted GIY-YIG superfamily endonuclease
MATTTRTDKAMKLTREVIEALPSIIALLPAENEWCVYALNCRDGGLYIGTTHHLPWRLYKLVTGAEGSSSAVRMAGGPSKLVRFMRVASEEAAERVATEWERVAKANGRTLVTDALAAMNSEIRAIEAFGGRPDF